MTNPTATTARPAVDLRTAYRQAQTRYDANPEHPQAIRELGWVYAHLLKDASGAGGTDSSRMLRGLGVVADFDMPADDTRWRESVGWSVCRFLLRHTPETMPLRTLGSVLNQAGAFIPAEAGLLRSVWWKALLRHAPTGIDWLSFVANHGWEGTFRPEDEQPEAYGEGKLAGPLLEKLIQSVARQLLAGVVLPDEVAEPWLARIAELTARHPDWHYLPYYHAKLLQRLDRTAESMAVFLPFARQKQGTGRVAPFWVWSMLAELVTPEQAPVCYARALVSGTPEDFLVKVRQQVAAWLIAQHRWSDARAEIERLVATRQASNWSVPAVVLQWMNDPLYTQTQPTPLGHWYAALLPDADSLLWADCAEVVGLVTGLDATGQYVNVAIDAQTAGSFPVGKFNLSPAVGDRLALRYTMVEKKGKPRLRVLMARATPAALTHIQTQTVTGPLRLPTGKTIGFVGDVYIPADLLAKVTHQANATLTVEAVSAWDAVKQKSGWRAFRIQGS